MSKVEVNTIEPQCGTTVTVGTCTSTIAVPGNVVKSNALQASDAGNIISQSGSTITVGASGDTITLASGASQSGFGREGSVDWQTGSIKTGAFTAANGEGYFINTTSGGVTMNLPAGSAGNIVACVDYANTADTNNITISADGSEKIQGSTDDHIIEAEGGSITLVYVDSTQGWKLVDTGTGTDLPQVALFTTATVSGSCNAITTCGDYKIATFKGPGTFCVSVVGNAPVNPAGGPNAVSYMVLAGGAGACSSIGGGGGAGGYREGRVTVPEYTASPLVAPAGGITITATGYPITVGSGGTAGAPGPATTTAGGTSTFDSITSAGGAIPAGGDGNPAPPVANGGSGGGGKHRSGSGGLGNQPPVSPPQGNDGGGGAGPPFPVAFAASGGGGAGAVGTPSPPGPGPGGPGGCGTTTSIDGTPTVRAGGGGGGGYSTAGGSGGPGGGGAGGSAPPGVAGTDATQFLGAGGGGGGEGSPTGGSGGSGVVIIRYKFQ